MSTSHKTITKGNVRNQIFINIINPDFEMDLENGRQINVYTVKRHYGTLISRNTPSRLRKILIKPETKYCRIGKYENLTPLAGYNQTKK